MYVHLFFTNFSFIDGWPHNHKYVLGWAILIGKYGSTVFLRTTIRNCEECKYKSRNNKCKKSTSTPIALINCNTIMQLILLLGPECGLRTPHRFRSIFAKKGKYRRLIATGQNGDIFCSYLPYFANMSQTRVRIQLHQNIQRYPQTFEILVI